MDRAIVHTVRDQRLSLWQSTVAEHARGQLGASEANVRNTDVHRHDLVAAVTDHVRGLEEDNGTLGATHLNLEDPHQLNVHLSKMGFELGNAIVDGDTVRAEKLREWYRYFSDKDPGFASCATTYAEYFLKYKGKFAYNDWKKEGGNSLEYGVIDYRLPNDAKVLILGDWGTGMDDAKELLRQAIRQHQPTAIIHLGDIYYSGTPSECDHYFAKVLDEVFATELGDGCRLPVFTIPGNHDYYALGHGYYKMVEGLNASINGATQKASYFCLRTEDNGWQFLGMDTGYYDSNPAAQIDKLFFTGPWLVESEVQWHLDKLKNFSGVTILLSHHQLFSAHAAINGNFSKYKNRPYLNVYLQGYFRPYFGANIAAWLWGHEHSQVLYKNGLFGLAKGRLIGASAWEELGTEDPYDIKFNEVSYQDPTKYRLGAAAGYFNHGYALIDFSTREKKNDAVKVEYYEFPSWGSTRPSDPKISKIVPETFERPKHQIQDPVKYGDDINLHSEGATVITPFENGSQYYPTIGTGAPAGLRITGSAGTVKDGDTVTVITRNALVGAYNTLGAWSTPSLYYYTPGYNQQNWTIRKAYPGDPEVRYGDAVWLENKYYTGQWLALYGKYLTTKKGETPSYWVIEQAIPDPPTNHICYGDTVQLSVVHNTQWMHVSKQTGTLEYYPTLAVISPVNLKVVAGAGCLSSGSRIQIQTTESGVGKYDILGAWKSHYLYYYNFDLKWENNVSWIVEKVESGGDEVIRRGDLVHLKNVYYSNKPYMCRTGDNYLTTTNEAVVWRIR